MNTPTPGAPAQMLIIAGNHQKVARTHPEDLPGGTADFAPIQLQVTDANSQPVPNLPITLTVVGKPNGMGVSVQQGSEQSVTVNTNAQGIATFAQRNGHSVEAYWATGQILLTATNENYHLGQEIQLTVIPTPAQPGNAKAQISIVSGNNQQVPRTAGEVAGGMAKFAPIQVKVTDPNGQPMPNVQVAWRKGAHPKEMAVQVDPSGAEPAVTLTNTQGLATLDKINGYSIYCYYATGHFTVVGSIDKGPSVTISGTVTS